MTRRTVVRLGVLALGAVTGLVGLAGTAQAAEPAFQLPFRCGETWRGDNPSSSAHATPWELDFNWGSGSDDLGKPVLAAAAGTVETAAYQTGNGYGNLVKIRHGSSNYYTYYAHLQRMAVSEDESVAQGEVIGYVGNTSATSPGISPHLHYEVRYGASGYPDNLRPATFNGSRFPYPRGSVTSHNCGTTPPANLAAKSVNGDRYDDVIGIDASGVAWLYPGTQGGGLGSKSRIGSGWTPYEKVAIGDSNGDGWADLFAQDGSVMYYWHNRGNGTFNERARVGGGWDDIDHFSITDVNGDNKADILARDNNNLNLYIGLGRGAFTEPDTVGPGWSGFPRHSGSDADADGDGDIWATNGNGDLYFWKRNGSSYSSAVDVGGGWNNYRLMTTMDINGDSRADIVAIHTREHTLHQWLGRGDGRFNPATQIGHGWETFRIAVF